MYAKKEFSIEIYTASDTAKANGFKEQYTPSIEVVNNLKRLHERIIVPILEVIDGKLLITSGYRCERLNNLICGSKNSQHMKGQAVDIVYIDHYNSKKNGVLFDFIRENLVFDQLIWEKGGKWVHVSLKEKDNRKQVLYL